MIAFFTSIDEGFSMAMWVITRWFICGFWSDLPEIHRCFFFGRSPWRQCSMRARPPKVAAQGCSGFFNVGSEWVFHMVLPMFYQHIWLVGGLEHGCYDFPYIGNFIIPTDELIFFRGIETTNQMTWDLNGSKSHRFQQGETWDQLVGLPDCLSRMILLTWESPSLNLRIDLKHNG